MTSTHDGSESDIGWDGFIAGALGAVTVAFWFLVLDIVAGHPLYTPTVLGEALFSGPAAATDIEHARQGTVMAYSAVHLGLFVVLGLGLSWTAARLRHRRRGVAIGTLAGVVLLLVVGAWVSLRVLAAPVAADLGAGPVLVGQLLALAGMAGYLLLRYPALAGETGDGSAGPAAA